MVRVLAIGPGFTGSNLTQVIDITVNKNITNCWYSQWQIQKNVMGGAKLLLPLTYSKFLHTY
jgi:hypothetical protein